MKDDTVSRQAAIDALLEEVRLVDGYYVENDEVIDKDDAIEAIRLLPSVQPEPLSDAYVKAVWTWLFEYQIKAAELKGRYTPYEVLSWVANDWRKEHE